MASQDNRPCINSPLTTDVDIDGNEIGVGVDIVLLDPQGYVGRVVLWDKQVPSGDDAEMLALPIALAIEQELGVGRGAGVEVWHLRSGSTETITQSRALRKLPQAIVLLDRFLAS